MWVCYPAVVARTAGRSPGSDVCDTGPRFNTTRWSLVLSAAPGPAHSRAALESLCRAYWYPLYAYARRAGHDTHRAEDLIQSFFARFIEKSDVAAARSSRGRFRSFLLASLKHFIANDWERERAAKRGGGRPVLSFDCDAADRRYAAEPCHGTTPERVYDRSWAITLLGEVLAAVRLQYAGEGRQRVFERLKGFISGDHAEEADNGHGVYARAAEELGMSELAVRVAVHRLRRRYARTLRSTVVDTLESPEEIEDELHDLFRSVAR
jgi:RNA polymerase sigma-70 factor (ECF subfamily)